MTYLHTSTLAPDHLHGGSPRPNPASTGRRLFSMASYARLVVLAYFHLLEQCNTPPFVYSEIVRKQRGGILHSPLAIAAPAMVLQLALRRFSQDEAHAQ